MFPTCKQCVHICHAECVTSSRLHQDPIFWSSSPSSWSGEPFE